jgi:hypothetical protein
LKSLDSHWLINAAVV